MVYYNEIDPYAAQWLRNLIKAGLLPHGVVDERDIRDIEPREVAGFTQCHFFAGIGGWPLALRQAGWPNDRPVWTGSCPCQPFSAAGKGAGFADERHLWPAFDWLIGQCRPDCIFGEQVEGPAGREWLDLVATDLEGHGYAFGTAVFPAAGVGAPQIRHRTYWVARADYARLEGRAGMPERADQWFVGARGVAGRVGNPALNGSRPFDGQSRTCGEQQESPRGSDIPSRLAGADEGKRGRIASGEGCERNRQARGWRQGDGGATGDCATGGVASADGGYASAEGLQRGGEHGLVAQDGSALGWVADSAGVGRREERPDAGGEYIGDRAQGRRAGLGASGCDLRPGPVNGFWGIADWLYCRDDKWRPVESGTFPLASGVSARVGRLRAYGNAICAPQAQAFVQAVIDHQAIMEFM